MKDRPLPPMAPPTPRAMRRSSIEQCSHVILLGSPAFWRHPEWKADVELAIELGKPVIVLIPPGGGTPADFERLRPKIRAGVQVVEAAGPAEAARKIREAIGAEDGEEFDVTDGALPDGGWN